MEEIIKRPVTLKANVSSSVTVKGSLTVQRIAEELNLIQKSDAGELEAIVDQIIAKYPKAVKDVTSGGKKSKKAKGFLLGQVMQKTKGQANPKVVSEILAGKLG